MMKQLHHWRKNEIIQVEDRFRVISIDEYSYLDNESDINNDHLIGNVQRVAIVPPNYEGKPKKGHLIFDASFECGMLNEDFSMRIGIELIDRKFGSN
jgi:hypothetical protein